MVVFYRGLQHEIVEAREGSSFVRLYGKDWSKAESLGLTGSYYWLRCTHADPCRLEYVKQVRTYSDDDRALYREQPMHDWVSAALCTVEKT